MLKKIAIRHTTHSGASRLTHPYITHKPKIRTNIFAGLFSVHNKISLRVMSKYVELG